MRMSHIKLTKIHSNRKIQNGSSLPGGGGAHDIMYSYKENYLIHFGIPGMKWGHRKARSSIGSDRRQLRKQYRNEYKAKKASGQSTSIGSGAHKMNLNKTNYANYKADKALKQKYGSKAIKEYKQKNTKTALKAGAALTAASLAGLGGMAASSVIKSKNINVGKSLLNAYLKANYKVGYVAGRTYATGQAIKKAIKK